VRRRSLRRPATCRNAPAQGLVSLEGIQAAQQWLLGSLYLSSWQQIHLILIPLLVVVALMLSLGRRLNPFQLGDEMATALGMTTPRLQITFAAAGALLAALAVFSPHIARRIAHTSSAATLPVAMCVGALLVLAADYTARRILEPTELPLVIVTIFLGAPYLLFLLYRTERDTGVS
jgi:ABC-type Fe3+-siderophore transport system permease subunit